MRHSERLDALLGHSDWPLEAFDTNGLYQPMNSQMLTLLPTRENPHDYSLDPPLTKHGINHAYHTGEFFRSLNLLPTKVYTSPAMRCIQTADTVLDGLGLRLQVPLRADLGLHEPTKEYLPLQSPAYYYRNGYNMDLNYHPLIAPANTQIIIQENHLSYYRRMYSVLKHIIAKVVGNSNLGYHSAETILVVTHRPCVSILAAMLNIDRVANKPKYLYDIEHRKRDEISFLSMVIAEYDSNLRQWHYLADYPEKKLPAVISPQRSIKQRKRMINFRKLRHLTRSLKKK
ncbi:unnamed protein product [Didymodactylos carnosus]|uniref:Uncharacterized protein n=1 Tax=Didymodactylos carnosus TaxID=1234261 RepID=A0A813UAI9_9BILA|nr:unnamed protein product [Didymodactylos carnosus]CAF3607453.1 unnamed protein product [Didymodactylos carnosus]